jgi:hypothetical protein
MKIVLFNLVIVILVIAIVVVAIPQYTTGQKAGQGYGQGYSDGINVARQTYMGGKNYNPTCGFNHTDSYCLGYKAGYLLEWGKMVLLH